MHDLAIRNVRLCDGTGRDIEAGELAVTGDRISAVGASVGAARENIDACGLVLAPGIIDTHTHFDAQVTWDPWMTPSPSLGVTTTVIGNCGFTIAPCRPSDRDITMRNLVKVEGMSLAAMESGIDWSFESFPEYLDLLERRGVGANLAAFVGHSSVRTYVMGDAAPERAAHDDEIEAMRRVVLEAMAAGAIGFATSTSPSHNGDGGRPMPSRLADEREMRALVGALGESGRGIFMLTKGAKTSIPFLESLAADTGRPVMVAALLHNGTRPQAVFNDLDAITAAQGRGRELYGQVSCCPLTMDFSLRSPYPLEGIAAWERAMKASSEELESVYADASFRAAVKRDLEEPIAVRLFNGEWERIRVVEAKFPRNRDLEGQTVAAIAEARGVHPLDLLLDLALDEGLDTGFTALLLNADEEAVGRLLTHPHSAIALSDAGAHLTFFCDAGFGLRLLGYWVRERGLMSLEAAVRELTGEPARIFGIPNRGVLRENAFADLLLFDPERVDRGPNRRLFDLPGGAHRLVTDPVGVAGVWVNGARVVTDGTLLADEGLPGRVLRSFEG